MQSTPEQGQRVEHFDAGQTIIQEGQLGNGLYVLMDGTAEVIREGVRVATVSQKGSFIGEISSILGCPCVATVRAIVPCDLLFVEKVTDYLQNSPKTALMLAQTLAARIMDMNRKLVALQKRFDQLAARVRGREGKEALGRIGQSLTEIHRIVAAGSEREA